MYDKRRYVRMDTVFPVEFTIVGEHVEGPAGRLMQGFTCNVSDGGMCIEFKSFGKDAEEKLKTPGVSLNLTINPAFSREPITARARVVWLQKEGERAKYLIGVAYESIDSAARKKLILFARRRRMIPRTVAVIGLVLLTALAVSAFHGRTLFEANLRLSAELREGAAKRSEVAGELVSLADDRKAVESELLKVREENKRLEQAVQGMNAEVTELNAQSSSLAERLAQQKTAYEKEVAALRARESAGRERLEEIGQAQRKLRESYQALEESGRENAEAVFRGMASWLASHQNRKTGLVASYEGDPDLENTAFTYDQALAVQAFLIGNEREAAAAVLSFFDTRAPKVGGAFYNSYDTVGGSPQETAIHTGPNVWMGIAALQFAETSGDGRFIPMARRIGDWVLRLQDPEGGIRGGPDVRWYGTEHNLDAYAFFGMLGRSTGDAKYAAAQERVFEWLRKYAYSNTGRAVNRGKGDATIATDTFAWSIAAIGPSRLIEAGLDPEAILEFARTNCEVKVDFHHPDGKIVPVQGFDFAKAQNIGRGGIVSTEWTAQMAVSYGILGRYFRKAGDEARAKRYLEKEAFYLSELQKMVITSPSKTGQGRGCLPYASADNVETGHGWRTPRGASTGSVAGTAYGLFAWKGYNPFQLSSEKGHDAGL